MVDDASDIVGVFKLGLEMNGYSVYTYGDSRQALDNFKPNLHDHIYLDIRMPGINGFELARAMWQKDPSADVCFMTAFEIYNEGANKVFKDSNTKCFVKIMITRACGSY